MTAPTAADISRLEQKMDLILSYLRRQADKAGQQRVDEPEIPLVEAVTPDITPEELYRLRQRYGKAVITEFNQKQRARRLGRAA